MSRISASHHWVGRPRRRNHLRDRQTGYGLGPWVWSELYITITVDVVPCCRIADSSVVKMGNVYEEELSRIWNNNAYRHLRRRIANDDIPHFCRRCYGMTLE